MTRGALLAALFVGVGAVTAAATLPGGAREDQQRAVEVTTRSDRDLTAAARAAAALPRLHSLLVSRRGEQLLEYYAPGVKASRPANIKSAAKSVISALVGIAIGRGLIKSVREPIVTYFPQLRRDPDPRKQTITVEDLLTMRAGLESTSGANYGRWVRSVNWVSFALGRPLVADPGTGMQYSTGASHLLSAIITGVSKESTWQFAQRTLGGPLKITLPQWTRDPQGIYYGGNEMLMTPRQMLAFGELYLNRGRGVGGAQIVPAAWVETSCVPRTVSRFDAGREYGYGWWIDEYGGHQACFAWGFGGQYIMVFPALELVVAATSSTSISDERRGYRRQLFDLLEQYVLPPGPVTSAPVQQPRTADLREGDQGGGRTPDQVPRAAHLGDAEPAGGRPGARRSAATRPQADRDDARDLRARVTGTMQQDAAANFKVAISASDPVPTLMVVLRSGMVTRISSPTFGMNSSTTTTDARTLTDFTIMSPMPPDTTTYEVHMVVKDARGRGADYLVGSVVVTR